MEATEGNAATPATGLVGQVEQKLDDQAKAAVTTLEQDFIAFVQTTAQHAEESIPHLVGDLAERAIRGLNWAKELAAKHGFTL